MTVTYNPNLRASEEMQRITNVYMTSFALWREARSEPREGKIALVFSILDRVQSPKWWGRDIPTVLGKRWQYSSLTDPKDKQLVLYPVYDDNWYECMSAVLDVFDGKVSNPVPGADSYYATYIDPPKWVSTARFVAQIGGHRFYDTDGSHPDNVREV